MKTQWEVTDSCYNSSHLACQGLHFFFFIYIQKKEKPPTHLWRFGILNYCNEMTFAQLCSGQVSAPLTMPACWGACSAGCYRASLLLHLICHLVASEVGNSLLNMILDSLLLPVSYFSPCWWRSKFRHNAGMHGAQMYWHVSVVRHRKVRQHPCKWPQ